jgi:anti-anti-sigma factor
VLRLVGELDLATAPQVQARLAAHRGRAILDLHQLTFIDSAGLRALVVSALERRPTEALVLRAPSAAVRRILELTDLSEQFAIEPEAPDEPT